jgi:hypothetical protein
MKTAANSPFEKAFFFFYDSEELNSSFVLKVRPFGALQTFSFKPEMTIQHKRTTEIIIK